VTATARRITSVRSRRAAMSRPLEGRAVAYSLSSSCRKGQFALSASSVAGHGRAPCKHGGHELAAAAHAELVERRGQVLLNGVGRDEQLFDDLPGAMSRMSQDVAAVENR
jgi:hypothetical protein